MNDTSAYNMNIGPPSTIRTQMEHKLCISCRMTCDLRSSHPSPVSHLRQRRSHAIWSCVFTTNKEVGSSFPPGGLGGDGVAKFAQGFSEIALEVLLEALVHLLPATSRAFPCCSFVLGGILVRLKAWQRFWDGRNSKRKHTFFSRYGHVCPSVTAIYCRRCQQGLFGTPFWQRRS